MTRMGAIAAWIVLGAATAAPVAVELKPATIASYDRYIAATEARLAAERSGQAPFLWIDQQAAADRTRLWTELGRGNIVLSKLETRDKGAAIRIDGGLVHHWAGTVFVPGVTPDRLIAFVQDYDAYPKVFDPLIPRAKVLSKDQDRFVVAMRTSVKKVITVVMDADYAVDYHRVSADRWWTTNVASNIHQVHSAGTPTERREPGDDATGYLWRFRMYCAIEAREGGTIEQCESVTLTRTVPIALSWIVRPFVTGIPRDTIEFTLGRVRSGLLRDR
jgi:hypothetical protein